MTPTDKDAAVYRPDDAHAATASANAAVPAPSAAPLPVPPRDTCRNCGAHAPGHFCGNCGQETRVALPTFAAFMREAAGRYFAMDGRFWRTMAALVARPGYLTQEYLRGRRKRYIRPARLFLVLYLILFAAIGLVQSPGNLSDEVVFVKGDAAAGEAGKALADAREDVAREIAKAREQADAQAGKASPAAPAGRTAGKPRDDALAIVSSDDGATFLGLDKDLNLTLRFANEEVWMPAPVKRRWEHFRKLPQEEKAERIYAGVLRYGPYAIVALLPAFALLMKLAYLGRRRPYPTRPQRYAEHLVYSAHLHAFAAVMLLALLLLPFGVTKLAIGAWIVWYVMRARQNVYGGRWWAGALRALVVGLVYLVLLACAMAGLVIVAIMLR